MFSSGDRRVDDWLSHRALPAMRKNTSTTRVLAQTDGTVAGYYTLANTALDVSLVPADLFDGEAPRHPPPTLTLAWLGVDRRFGGRGLGTKLFARALAGSTVLGPPRPRPHDRAAAPRGAPRRVAIHPCTISTRVEAGKNSLFVVPGTRMKPWLS